MKHNFNIGDILISKVEPKGKTIRLFEVVGYTAVGLSVKIKQHYDLRLIGGIFNSSFSLELWRKATKLELSMK